MDAAVKAGGVVQADAVEVTAAWVDAEAVGNSEREHGRYNGDNSGHDNAHDSDHGNDGAVVAAVAVCAVKMPMPCTEALPSIVIISSYSC
jgi:hypothetical protein